MRRIVASVWLCMSAMVLMVMLFSSGALAQASKPDDESEQGESGDEIMERYRYLYVKHAGGPGRQLAPDAYEKAVQSKLQFEHSQHFSSLGLPSPWTSVNPSGMFYNVTGANYISGRTNSFAFSPTDANTFYIAAAGGGVWKTTNGGTNWTQLTDNLTSLMSGSIAIDPSNANVLYYGTGEQNYSLDSYYGDGVYKTTNAGTSWSKVATTTVGSYISQIIVDPTSSSIVYLSGSSGVYKSTNAGATWSPTPSGSPVNSLVIDPTNTQVLFGSVGTGYLAGNTVIKTTNGGTSWSTLAGGLPSSSVGRIALAIAASDHNTLYASISNSSSSALLGLYRTTDSGVSWTAQSTTPNYMSSQGWYDNAVCVKLTDANTVIAGGLDNYRSTTGGTSLTKITNWSTGTSSNMSHADIHFLGYNGTILYCGSDGGVYKSTDDGTTWSDMNATISSLQYQSADYDPTNTALLYGGCQDNNKQTSTNGGTTWIQRATGDGGYTVVDPGITSYNYGQYVQGSCQRSANSGVSFTEIRPSAGTGGLFYNPFEMAPGDPQTIVYGVSQVFKTTIARTATTSAASWPQIASAATVGSLNGVSAIGISWTDVNKIYIGTDNGHILATTNNGTSWTPTTGYPYVSDLAVDPSNDNICYATFTGFGATAHVYKTTNAGTSWFSITSTLPNIPCNTIVVVPQTPRWLFVGTDLGVYQSTDDGLSWASYNTGLPTVTIYDLKYKDATKKLIAATHGRGCFMNDLTAALPIQLASFAATYTGGNDVRVNWRTISEVNNYGFEVQKSPDNESNYQTIAGSFVHGYGTTNEPHNYVWTDHNAGHGHWFYRLKQTDLDGAVHYSDGSQVDVLTSVAEHQAPSEFALRQNYPNPFNPTTTFEFDVPKTSHIRLKIYNVVGQEVATLVDRMQEAGTYKETWNAEKMSSGVYYYKLEGDSFVKTRKLLLLK